MGTMVSIPARPTDLEGYLARPHGDTWGGILVLHARYGLEPGYCELSERLAAQGLAALGVHWQTREQEPPTADSIEDIRAAKRFLRQHTSAPLGLIGFCRGGTLVYWAASDDPEWQAGVAFYSLPKSNSSRDPANLSLADAAAPNGELLILHGARDVPAPMETIVEYCRKLSEGGTRYTLKIYSEMGHRFFLPTDAGHDPAVAQDCWDELLRFLRSSLGSRVPSRES